VWLDSLSERWTVNVADRWRKTVLCMRSAGREGAFAGVGPRPFHDGSSG